MTTPTQSGRLKMLAGPKALQRLIKRLSKTYKVTLDDKGLRWNRNTSPGGVLPWRRVVSVEQHGKTFVVHLRQSSSGIGAMTFRAKSKAEASRWTESISALIPDTPPPQSPPKGIAAEAIASTPDAPSDPVKLSYTVHGESFDEQFDLLVIACDPRNLKSICDFTGEELADFDALGNFTFHTTLIEVKLKAGASHLQKHGVIFAPKPLDMLNGSIYGYRNETAKQFGLEVANGLSHNLVTVYQLLGHSDVKRDAAWFEAKLKAQIPTLTWWPFEDELDIKNKVTTPYFNHFERPDLKKGRPWRMLARQGQKQTLLVHASTCFESVLHCWGYINLMFDTVPGATRALPANKSAPIAILGAGVSGLLSAVKLTRMGYSNLKILETTQRYGGKTHTLLVDGPKPTGSTEKTVCELGTCYMSPAYEPMLEDLREFLKGNKEIDFTADNESFRGIVTLGELPASFGVDDVVPYNDYVILKAEAVEGLGNNPFSKAFVYADLATDLFKYNVLHLEYMGWDRPMPPEQPEALRKKFGRQTFRQFLEDHDLESMVGMLQYGYEVQGYGDLDAIPAYYGLIWITPAITWTILADALGDVFGLKDKPVVTAWTKGWEDLWDQVVSDLALQITFDATTTSIVRP